MTSRQIECFLVAAQKLNFTSASEILFLSQSNMSRNISLLEEELDMQLFVRQKNKVFLTPSGVIMYEAFSQMKNFIEHKIDIARNGEENNKGRLVIGFICYMDLDSFFTDRLTSFKEKYPEIDVELTALSPKPFEHILESGEADIIITHNFNTPKSPNIFSVELGEAPINITFSKKHSLAGKENISIQDFDDETFWISENVNSPDLIQLIHRAGAFYNLENYKIEISPSFDTALLNVSLGKGLLVTDAFTSLKFPKTLTTIQLDPQKFHANILMNWSKNNYNPSITKFVSDNIVL